MLVANSASASTCPNEELRLVLHSGQLPDCRAFELVTPSFKEGDLVELNSISEDGLHVISKSVGVFAGAEHENSGEIGGGTGTAYEFSRRSAGWQTKPLGPLSTQYSASALDFASADLSKTLWRLRTPSQPEGEADLYRREANDNFVKIGPLQPPSEEARFGGEANEVGVSQDLSHVLFEKRPNWGVWPGDTTSENFSLYEYAGVDQTEPELVGVKNNRQLSSNSEAQLISQCGTVLGSEGDAYNALSSDGAIVFFTAMACGSPPVNELYARIDQSQTVAISEPVLLSGQCTGTCATAEHKEGVFVGASQDGSKVFFTTEQPLLNGDRDTTNDLYEAELENGALRRLIMVSEGETMAGTSENDPTPGEGADVQGVVRVSENGAHVYFVASGVLTEAANGQGDHAEAGADNLYVVDTVSGRTRFIAKLSAEDGQIWQSIDSGRPVASTADGGFLVLVSRADLTHEGTSGQQIYEYTLQSGVLKRISLGQHSALGLRIPSPSYVGGYRPTETFSHMTMSDDGSYVFFESPDGLTPQAPDDRVVGCFFEFQGKCFSTAYIQNIYEYHEGHVYLITSVRPPSEESVLRGTDPSGGDVFFTTTDALVAEDVDTQQDLYDARIDGGFPKSPSAYGCSGDACHGSLSASPLLPMAGSTTQAGEDGLVPPVPKPTSRSKSLTRAQKLSKALKACKKKPRRRRCERTVYKTYGRVQKSSWRGK